MEDRHTFAAGSLFAYLPATERKFLMTLGLRRSFPRDELLLREGDPTDHVFVVISGWVRVYSTASDGQEVLIAIRGPGDVIGDLAALNGWPRTASVRSLEVVTVVQIRSSQFVACLRGRPDFAIGMIKQMSARLREAESIRVDVATMDVTSRVATYLLRLIDQHGIQRPAGLLLRIPLSQQDIANRVGASRRAVARAMAVLRDRQIISTAQRRIVILRPEVLDLFARPGSHSTH